MIVNRILATLLVMYFGYSIAVFVKNKWGVDVEKTILIFFMVEFITMSYCMGDILKELKAIRKDKHHE
ncbi:hypothetical protein AP064_05130 [Candidatus Liberibacter solanacearum]|uniref:hypothetical protein n=1 Tax=Candidatus Liberibacter solanacearum TaxID=556287 RepID=UPI0005F9BBDE|nr:hypothetical protein [Candidatus Liberibacter solanacearum]KQC48743.1 hypothetical protein AP064_05130 [Candidatus Liberibacter solanacearum]